MFEVLGTVLGIPSLQFQPLRHGGRLFRLGIRGRLLRSRLRSRLFRLGLRSASRVSGTRVIGTRVIGTRVIGTRVIGARVTGVRVIGARVIGARVIGIRIRRRFGSIFGLLFFVVHGGLHATENVRVFEVLPAFSQRHSVFGDRSHAKSQIRDLLIGRQSSQLFE